MANILGVQFIVLLAIAAFQFHQCFWPYNENILLKSNNNRLEFKEFKPTQKECNTDCKVNKSNHSIKPRIDGGSFVDEPIQWPFFATISLGEGPVCGGVIVDDRLILTSNSCYSPMSKEKDNFIITNTTFRFFGVQGIVSGVDYVCASGIYTIKPSNNGLYRSFADFAVILTKSSLLNINDTVNKAIKVKRESTKMILEEDAACYIVSHTKSGAGLLRMVSAPVKISKCYLQDASQFCFEGSKETVLTCDNDSGSAIVCYEKETNSYVTVGIVSTVLRNCNPNMINNGAYNVATNISFIYNDYNECLQELTSLNKTKTN